jgi:hypothetical protein
VCAPFPPTRSLLLPPIGVTVALSPMSYKTRLFSQLVGWCGVIKKAATQRRSRPQSIAEDAPYGDEAKLVCMTPGIDAYSMNSTDCDLLLLHN